MSEFTATKKWDLSWLKNRLVHRIIQSHSTLRILDFMIGTIYIKNYIEY